MGGTAAAGVGNRHFRYRWSKTKAPMDKTAVGEYDNGDDSRVEYSARVPITMPLMTMELILPFDTTSGLPSALRRVGIPATPTTAKMTINETQKNIAEKEW